MYQDAILVRMLDVCPFMRVTMRIIAPEGSGVGGEVRVVMARRGVRVGCLPVENKHQSFGTLNNLFLAYQGVSLVH